MTMDDIGRLCYGKSLTSVSWSMFAHVVTLEFGDQESRLRMTLSGVYALVARQQADSPMPSDFGPECEIQYAAISNHSDFLVRFVSNELGFDTETIVYDALGHTHGDSEFVAPYHLAVSCDAGNLDIVFREYKIDSCEEQHDEQSDSIRGHQGGDSPPIS